MCVCVCVLEVSSRVTRWVLKNAFAQCNNKWRLNCVRRTLAKIKTTVCAFVCSHWETHTHRCANTVCLHFTMVVCGDGEQISDSEHTYVIMLYCAIAIDTFAEIGQFNHFWLRKALCKIYTRIHVHTHNHEGVLSQKVKLYLNVTHVYFMCERAQIFA